MPYSFLDFAQDVLKDARTPLTYQEVWQAGAARGLDKKLKTSGKTPWQTLGARLYVEVRDNSTSAFLKVGDRPARFFLRSREAEVPKTLPPARDQGDAKDTSRSPGFRERDLHPVFTYYAFANPTFNRGRPIYTKTIHHEGSKKRGYSEWLHPDMVGFYLPLETWDPAVIDLNRVSDNNALRIFSFELKKELTRSNYRESYFQAVSNSSWAHEGYLVASEILQDDEFLAELERLASSFGIGIIHLDLRDLSSSTILYPARTRNYLDWETINKLSTENDDFQKFLQDVKIDLEGRRVHESEYDRIIRDIDSYIVSTLKVTPLS